MRGNNAIINTTAIIEPNVIYPNVYQNIVQIQLYRTMFVYFKIPRLQRHQTAKYQSNRWRSYISHAVTEIIAANWVTY